MQHSAHFRRRLAGAGLEACDMLCSDGFWRLPVLTREDLQRGGDVFCDVVPDWPGPVSTG